MWVCERELSLSNVVISVVFMTKHLTFENQTSIIPVLCRCLWLIYLPVQMDPHLFSSCFKWRKKHCCVERQCNEDVANHPFVYLFMHTSICLSVCPFFCLSILSAFVCLLSGIWGRFFNLWSLNGFSVINDHKPFIDRAKSLTANISDLK